MALVGLSSVIAVPVNKLLELMCQTAVDTDRYSAFTVPMNKFLEFQSSRGSLAELSHADD